MRVGSGWTRGNDTYGQSPTGAAELHPGIGSSVSHYPEPNRNLRPRPPTRKGELSRRGQVAAGEFGGSRRVW